MSASRTTKTFIHELPLRVTPTQEQELMIRFDCARQLYNACLGEALRRLRSMRESRAFKVARTMKKGHDRTAELRRLDARFGFREYDLHAYAARTKNACYIGGHMDAHTVQKIASRAFLAVREYAFGKRGRPRFKSRRGLHALEGKTNASGIRWRDGIVHWGELELRAVLDPKDKWSVQAHALGCPVKYVRIVRRRLRGRVRWYAQLVLEGRPKVKAKHPVGNGAVPEGISVSEGKRVVGLDIGPSIVAAVGESEAFLEAFCPGLKRDERAIRRIQRKMDRSLRATNQDCYGPNGVPTKRPTVRSARYHDLQDELTELRRKETAARKTAHGRLANRILAMGNEVKTEKISYSAWQRTLGKSVSKRAPGTLISMLRRKAENVGGELIEFSTYATKLSQTCVCGAVEKKPLSQRWHECPICGAAAQRDLFSAFLARFVVSERGKVRVDVSRARKAWPGAEPLLLRTASALERQTASGGHLLASFGVSSKTSRSRSRSSAEENSNTTDAADAVASPCGECESRGETVSLCS